MTTPNQAKQDLEYIFEILTSAQVQAHSHFSQDLLDALQKNIDRDKKTKTRLILKVHSIEEPKISSGWFDKTKEKAKINTIISYHWEIDGEPSYLPGSVDISEPFAENLKTDFILTYQNGKLINFSDPLAAIYD